MTTHMDNSVCGSFQLSGYKLSARLEDLEQLLDWVVFLHGLDTAGFLQTPAKLEELLV